VNLLPDTHVLLWAAAGDALLPPRAARMIEAPDNLPWSSVASLWEAATKRALDRPDFRVEPAILRAGLRANEYRELAVEGRHVLALSMLPPLHRDPFDRILLAQAVSDGLTLLTADDRLAGYPGPVCRI
jgi:PIN domain nuclease of toxin-antitoxin system